MDNQVAKNPAHVKFVKSFVNIFGSQGEKLLGVHQKCEIIGRYFKAIISWDCQV